MTARNLLILAAILVGVFLITTIVSKYSRAKPVTEHTDNRKAIVKADSLQSVIDILRREKLNNRKQAQKDSIREAKGNYKVIVQRDAKIEYHYRKAPSMVTCDSVITSKNGRIATLETINHQHERMDLMNDSIITSFQGSIRAKDQAIGQLNEGYKQATTDLQKAKRPKRFGLGVHVGYGIGQNIGPVPVVSVGLNYSLIRF